MTPTQTIPASVGSVVTMICDVSANPANVTFFWHTKHTDLDRYEHSYDGGGYGDDQSHPSSHYIINDKGLKSRLEVRIENGDDFGQYSSWAKNYAGTQEEPCYYNVYGKRCYTTMSACLAHSFCLYGRKTRFSQSKV